MYCLKLHDKVYDDLKVLDKALVIKVFKKLKQIQQSTLLLLDKKMIWKYIKKPLIGFKI